MKAFVISENDAGQRLDRFLQKAAPRLSQGLMHKLIRKKRIKLNGARCEASSRLCAGDTLALYISDELLAHEPEGDFAFAGTALDIVYEDENLMLINKPPGLVVHEDDDNTVDTLINRIKRYLSERGAWNPKEEQSFTPALCNRLDRNTGGIVIAAKNAAALRILNQKVRDRELSKRYLCVAAGKMPKRADTLTAYIEKDATRNIVQVTDHKTAQNLTAITRYRVLDESKEASLLEVELITGRTHQIRAHLAHIGHPLLGDGKYGNALSRKNGYSSQALYAYKLTFDFTTDGGVLSYLNGKSFEVRNVWLRDQFYSDKAAPPALE